MLSLIFQRWLRYIHIYRKLHLMFLRSSTFNANVTSSITKLNVKSKNGSERANELKERKKNVVHLIWHVFWVKECSRERKKKWEEIKSGKVWLKFDSHGAFYCHSFGLRNVFFGIFALFVVEWVKYFDLIRRRLTVTKIQKSTTGSQSLPLFDSLVWQATNGKRNFYSA